MYQIKKIKPDYVIHGNDRKTEIQREVRQRVIDTRAEWNGELVEQKYTEGISSTDIITEAIDVLLLDCDLYESYMLCLEKLYCKVKKGCSIIFDEYYSLKYLIARITVNKYFERKNRTFEIFKTIEGFEKWCFVVN